MWRECECVIGVVFCLWCGVNLVLFWSFRGRNGEEINWEFFPRASVCNLILTGREWRVVGGQMGDES